MSRMGHNYFTSFSPHSACVDYPYTSTPHQLYYGAGLLPFSIRQIDVLSQKEHCYSFTLLLLLSSPLNNFYTFFLWFVSCTPNCILNRDGRSKLHLLLCLVVDLIPTKSCFQQVCECYGDDANYEGFFDKFKSRLLFCLSILQRREPRSPCLLPPCSRVIAIGSDYSLWAFLIPSPLNPPKVCVSTRPPRFCNYS